MTGSGSFGEAGPIGDGETKCKLTFPETQSYTAASPHSYDACPEDHSSCA